MSASEDLSGSVGPLQDVEGREALLVAVLAELLAWLPRLPELLEPDPQPARHQRNGLSRSGRHFVSFKRPLYR